MFMVFSLLILVEADVQAITVMVINIMMIRMMVFTNIDEESSKLPNISDHCFSKQPRSGLLLITLGLPTKSVVIPGITTPASSAGELLVFSLKS